MKPSRKILNETDKVIFEKALKIYLFSRQHDVSKLQDDLKQRIRYLRNVAYSLIIRFLREDTFHFEYMDFINDELKTLQSLPGHTSLLMIKPEEVDEIELQEPARFLFKDEEDETEYKVIYHKSKQIVEITKK